MRPKRRERETKQCSDQTDGWLIAGCNSLENIPAVFDSVIVVRDGLGEQAGQGLMGRRVRPGRAGVGCSGQNKPWPRKGGLVPPGISCGQSKHCLAPG